MIGFDFLVPLLLLPSIPAFFSSLFLCAAIAFHLDASESRNGQRGLLFAAWVANPIHIALALAAANAPFHLPTSVGDTR